MFAGMVKFVLLASCFQAGNACKDNTVEQAELREDSLINNVDPPTGLTPNPWLSYYYNSQQQGRSPAGNNEELSFGEEEPKKRFLKQEIEDLKMTNVWRIALSLAFRQCFLIDCSETET